MRVKVGTRLFRDPVTGIYKNINVYEEQEPDEPVRQIRPWMPGQDEPVEPEPVPEPPVERPAPRPKPRKPRPYVPRPKKEKPPC